MKPRKLSSGKWFIQVQANGVRRSFSAPTRAEVMRKAMKYKAEPSEANTEPLGAVIDRYIEAKRNVLSPSTITSYEMIRRRNFQDIMNVRVDKLTTEMLQVEVNVMAADKSPKSVRNAYGLIRAALKMFAPELHFNITMPAKKRIEYHVPTTAEVCELIVHASRNMKTAIMLAAFCGLRRGEIAALTYGDIEGNMLHVQRATVLEDGRFEVVKSPKTFTSDRYVTIPDYVLNEIRDDEAPAGKRVCPLCMNSMTHHFIELRDKLGYKCRFHDLRHYYASVLHAIGVPDQYIMKFGGWKSDSVLKSVYRGTLDDFERRSAEQINSYFSESANKLLTPSNAASSAYNQVVVRAPSRPLHKRKP